MPINKLDLDKVTEIQKLQAQGLLPPLEESKVIDKKEMRDQVREMIIQDNDSEDESQMLRQEEDNRRRINLEESSKQHDDDDESEIPANYYSEDDEYGDEEN